MVAWDGQMDGWMDGGRGRRGVLTLAQGAGLWGAGGKVASLLGGATSQPSSTCLHPAPVHPQSTNHPLLISLVTLVDCHDVRYLSCPSHPRSRACQLHHHPTSHSPLVLTLSPVATRCLAKIPSTLQSSPSRLSVTKVSIHSIYPAFLGFAHDTTRFLRRRLSR